jgi:hypothetical protein
MLLELRNGVSPFQLSGLLRVHHVSVRVYPADDWPVRR